MRKHVLAAWKPDNSPRATAWSRTLYHGLWYLPLVHIGLPYLAVWLDRSYRLPVPARVRVAGRGLALLGGALTSWSVYRLVRDGQGTPAPHDPPQVFVVRGPYRFCRNPMELGNLLTLVGRAVANGCPRLAVASLLFAAATHCWVVLVEEPYLLRHFGAQYQMYRRAVPRWGWSLRRPRSGL